MTCKPARRVTRDSATYACPGPKGRCVDEVVHGTSLRFVNRRRAREDERELVADVRHAVDPDGGIFREHGEDVPAERVAVAAVRVRFVGAHVIDRVEANERDGDDGHRHAADDVLVRAAEILVSRAGGVLEGDERAARAVEGPDVVVEVARERDARADRETEEGRVIIGGIIGGDGVLSEFYRIFHRLIGGNGNSKFHPRYFHQSESE